MKSLHLALGISLTLLAACVPEKHQADLTSTLSPWHSLTAEEIREVAAAVTESVDGTLVFNRISLLEPDKSQALSWQTDTNAARGADVLYRLDKLSYRVRYDFQTSELSPPALLTSGQPMLVGQELYTALFFHSKMPEE